MANPTGPHDNISSKVEIEYPDFTKLPDQVREKFEKLPTKVNFFRMLGYSPGAFIPVIDLTNAIFRDLTLSDYHKEMMVLLLAAHENVAYEWEQHVSIAQVAGVRPDQFVAIAEGCLEDATAFKEDERVLLRFGQAIIDKGKAPGVLFKHTLQHFSLQELSDAILVIGFYQMLSGYIQTFDIAVDAQSDGNWIKG
ncbi:carboxymuconolactone decarboxylase family protein [Pseudomonas syringae]|uniref:carboxymuconolactone decarboxylase family protein n=1 Tax=Pseudomonas TaxID=286 RepID=UPI000CD1528A|nr:carboxymuconolactone decarboxylase [Pseudomonas syringae]MCF5029204.1 carboxymuconolactone decarboxylase [Pseudomonas syringae]POD20802.1 carboxymuconolactone decarboxylase [Pseudomonas syringae pv. syringae]UQB18122.1 carboxymuconolactone decarboxylase [Pseudomonas syringae pv. syringae]